MASGVVFRAVVVVYLKLRSNVGLRIFFLTGILQQQPHPDLPSRLHFISAPRYLHAPFPSLLYAAVNRLANILFETAVYDISGRVLFEPDID